MATSRTYAVGEWVSISGYLVVVISIIWVFGQTLWQCMVWLQHATWPSYSFLDLVGYSAVSGIWRFKGLMMVLAWMPPWPAIAVVGICLILVGNCIDKEYGRLGENLAPVVQPPEVELIAPPLPGSASRSYSRSGHDFRLLLELPTPLRDSDLSYTIQGHEPPGDVVDATFSYAVHGDVVEPEQWAGFSCEIEVNKHGSRGPLDDAAIIGSGSCEDDRVKIRLNLSAEMAKDLMSVLKRGNRRWNNYLAIFSGRASVEPLSGSETHGRIVFSPTSFNA